MKLKWCKHSYFIVETGGLKIAIDPHDGGSIGLESCRVEADLVLVTHNHYDHNAIEIASGAKTIVVKWRPGSFKIGEVEVKGFKYYHDNVEGRLRGETIAYKLEAEKLKILHLGDIGHHLTNRDVEELGEIDILMIPVGGVYTINYKEAWTIIQQVSPKIAIPMHYWTPKALTPLDPLDKLLNIVETPKIKIEKDTLEVDANNIPEKTTLLVIP